MFVGLIRVNVGGMGLDCIQNFREIKGMTFAGIIWGEIDWMEIGIVGGWIVKLDRSEYCRE